MGEVIEFKSDSPHSWTPVEALKRAIEIIESGETECDRVYVAMCCSPKDGEDGKATYTLAGMHRIEAIGWLMTHIHLLQTAWE